MLNGNVSDMASNAQEQQQPRTPTPHWFTLFKH